MEEWKNIYGDEARYEELKRKYEEDPSCHAPGEQETLLSAVAVLDQILFAVLRQNMLLERYMNDIAGTAGCLMAERLATGIERLEGALKRNRDEYMHAEKSVEEAEMNCMDRLIDACRCSPDEMRDAVRIISGVGCTPDEKELKKELLNAVSAMTGLRRTQGVLANETDYLKREAEGVRKSAVALKEFLSGSLKKAEETRRKNEEVMNRWSGAEYVRRLSSDPDPMRAAADALLGTGEALEAFLLMNEQSFLEVAGRLEEISHVLEK